MKKLSDIKLNKTSGTVVLTALLATMIILTLKLSKPIITFVADSEKFRIWVEKSGILGKCIFIILIALQVIIAFIPGEPFEIGAGYAFGPIEGTLLCMTGQLIGTTVIFLIVRTIGKKLLYVFFSKQDIEKVSFLNNAKKLNTIMFIIFLIPGTPKDILSYFAPLTKIKLTDWLFIATFARIPSLVTSTVGGSALGEKNYIFAAVVFAVTAVISLFGMYFYNKRADVKTH